METTWFNNRWKSNAEQPYIKNAKRLLFALKHSKKFKRYTSQSVRKQLVESLIFSRLDYCNNLFIDLPQYQVRRMIKLQKSCASKFCSIENVVSRKWQLVPERIDFAVLKMKFKGLLNERVPSNFRISIKEKKREKVFVWQNISTFTIKLRKKKSWPWGWCVKRKTYCYSHVQPGFCLYQLRLLSGTIAREGTPFFFFFYVPDAMWRKSFQYF